MSINKFTTLLDLSRQAKIITGETATFDGKIEVGIPFSGYPTGVDTGTTVSLGVVSTQTAVFSGNTGTTLFDVSNVSSPNYSSTFSGYTATTWTNPLFSGGTSGLTLPITTLSADTQIVGPFWTLTQTGYTGEYIIGTQYTGYSITYSFNGVSSILSGTSFSGFTTASQENFSAGTLDYKGPLDYLQSVEDATIDGRLYTNKITISNGASASTIGYVLTQTGSDGEAEWLPNSSADTNTYVTGGTLSGERLILEWNNGGFASPIDLSSLSGGTFTGNTSGTCIGDLYVSKIHSCSPLQINPNDEGSVYFGSTSGVTIDLLNYRLGLGTATPQYFLDFLDVNSRFYYDPTSSGGNLVVSGSTNIPRLSAGIPSYLTKRDASVAFGIRSWDDTTWTNYGKVGDSFFRSSTDSNGLNIINAIGTGTEDYIRFYAGQDAITGNTPDIHIQGSGSTRGYIGINTSNPEYLLDVVNTNSRLFYNPTSTGGVLTVSGSTNIPRFGVLIPSYLTKPSVAVTFGIRSWDDATYSNYGKVGDAFFRAGNETYGLNIINDSGTGTEDYIRFYAGQNANGTTPDIHIQGSGSTRGYVGFGKNNPSEMLDIADNVNIDGTLTIGTIGGTTPISNLGYDINGNIVTGGTVNLSRRITSVDAGSDPNINNVEVVFYTASIPGGTIYLNTDLNVAGKEIILIRTSTTNTATISGSGGNKVNGAANKPLPTTVYSKVNCISDGFDWYCTSQTVI